MLPMYISSVYDKRAKPIWVFFDYLLAGVVSGGLSNFGYSGLSITIMSCYTLVRHSLRAN